MIYTTDLVEYLNETKSPLKRLENLRQARKALENGYKLKRKRYLIQPKGIANRFITYDIDEYDDLIFCKEKPLIIGGGYEHLPESS